jgi:adenosylcobinamide-phosphate synthase
MPDINLPLPLYYLSVLALALAFDLIFGEPSALLHPVIWMGRLVKLWDRFAPSKGPALQFIYGLVMVLVSVGGLFALTWWGLGWLRVNLFFVALPLEAYLLKGCFSLKMLGEVGLKIRHLLKSGKLDEARFEMRSLVSRDTSGLDEGLIIAATVESVAENTTDSFVAPLFFFALLGAPGALAYRLTNTFDSMVGYRGKYEYLGKASARLDDLLNLVPARLTALLLVLSAGWYKGNRQNAWRIMLRDSRNTASPNAGWTMAAMAGALQVRLEKLGHYRLGDDQTPVSLAHINRSVAALYIIALEITTLFTVNAVLISFILLN